jgi:hypothetical protein
VSASVDLFCASSLAETGLQFRVRHGRAVLAGAPSGPKMAVPWQKLRIFNQKPGPCLRARAEHRQPNGKSWQPPNSDFVATCGRATTVRARSAYNRAVGGRLLSTFETFGRAGPRCAARRGVGSASPKCHWNGSLEGVGPWPAAMPVGGSPTHANYQELFPCSRR